MAAGAVAEKLLVALYGIEIVAFVSGVGERRMSTAEIMRHLYELGHRRIGLVMGPEASSTSRDRARGALNYLRERGVPTEDSPVMWNAFSYEAGYSCATQMLSMQPQLTAITE